MVASNASESSRDSGLSAATIAFISSWTVEADVGDNPDGEHAWDDSGQRWVKPGYIYGER